MAAEQDGGFEEREAAQAVHHAAHVLVEARGLNGGDGVIITKKRL